MDLTNISADRSWLQKHERLVIVLLGVLLVAFISNKYINYSAEDAKQKAQAAVQTLQLSKQRDDDLKTFMSQQAAQYTQLVQSLQADNRNLVSGIQSRNAALQKQQQSDAKLPLPDIGKRWQQELNIPDGGIQATDKGLLVDDPTARATITELDKIPVLEENFENGKTIVANKDSEIDSLTKLNDLQKTQISGLNDTITKNDQACKLEVDAEKKNSRKQYLRGFKHGGIVGFIVGIFAGHAIP